MKTAFAFTLFATGAEAFGGAQQQQQQQQQQKEPAHTSAEWKIWAASTAGPPELSATATIVDGDMSVLREGTSDWSCIANANPRPYPADGWGSAHEAMPVCFDSAGMTWIQSYMTGAVPNPPRSSIMYMFHGDMGEDNSKPGVFNEANAAPGQWIESGAHIMLTPKDVSELDGYPTDPFKGEPYVMFAGTPYAHLMIPMQHYYKYTDFN